MPSREIAIINRLGMHARAAAEFTKTASQYRASVFVSKDGLEINGKSIMGVLMLAAAQGSTITIRTEGDESQEALDVLTALVENRFGEET